MNPRIFAVDFLSRVFAENSYSNIALRNSLEKSDMDKRDRKFCSALCYGVIERKITLDYIISNLSSRPVEKLDRKVLNILRCGLYQILYMDSVPDSAAVNESVKLCRNLRVSSACGMVNAVLRKFIREGKSYALPDDIVKSMSIKYSVREWIVKSLTEDYGTELAENLLSDSLGSVPMTVRMNSTKCTEEEFFNDLGTVSAEKNEILPHCYNIKIKNGDPVRTSAFEKGFFHVQDIASQLCAYSLSLSENDTVLDMCSAPGGKAFTMAEIMNGTGKVYACDLHTNRCRLIREGAERLGLKNVDVFSGDSSVYDEKTPKFLKILCDVPCSGLGAVRRKPEIKYKSEGDFDGLPELQYKIAENAVRYLKEGGEMVYSTCTLRKAENENVVERILREYPEMETVRLPEPLGSRFGCMASIFPVHFGSDGFFIAKLRKRGD